MVGRVFAVLAAIAFAPFHALIAALIYLEDRGPVFYRSKRVGKEGRAFEMFKYRSMRVGAAPKVDEGFKTVVAPNDERVTAIGRLLRCGLDEIPQVVNIIRGEMAWIGPRPDELWMLPRYGSAIRERLAVLPGITGLAQVCDSRHLTTARSYALDIWATRHRTPALTLRIFLVTPLFMLGWRKVEFANGEVAEIERECLVELEESRLAGRTAGGTG
jgi:undecaprenyl phosphate N,N'-diacetylbacillosamine 1-phosphate transferase